MASVDSTEGQETWGQEKARIGALTRRWATGGKVAGALAVAAAVSGIATYVALTNSSDAVSSRTVLYLLLLDLTLLLLLGTVIARRIVALWAARRSGLAGAKLHGRLVALFSLVAITPTIIVGVFSTLFLDWGQAWFSERVRGVLDNSRSVAERYTEEHRRVIRADILAMANDLNNQAPLLSNNPELFDKVVSGQAALRNLFEAVVFDGTGEVLARANFGFGLGIDRFPRSAIQEANDGEVVILTGENDDRVRALVSLDRFFNTYLYVSRYVDPEVVAQSEQAIQEYEELMADRSQFQILFTGIFIAVSLWILLIAVWVGLWMATRIVQPVSGLVMATEKVREGDLSARVTEGDTGDEIATLNRAFNRMASQLQEQRVELIDANRQLDDRRRFTEAVLGGVTAGVIGLDKAGRVNLPNRSALKMLEVSVTDIVERPIEDVVPELTSLFETARNRPDRVAEGQVNIIRNGRTRNLMVRISGEISEGDLTGFVVTFDDITQLVAAQRTAAWADVARRIAHEIKNPLTPIQLSAERLKKRFGKKGEGGDDVFAQCTDTIVRHVSDIRRMVDEFSAFARMPAPVFQEEDLVELVRQAVFTLEVAHPDIAYSIEEPDQPVMLTCDGRLLSQALTNIVKNASEAIEYKEETKKSKEKGEIAVSVEEEAERTVVTISDTGPGLPPELMDRLTEPYITTRAKGTGLGLAICRKIVEDHGGELILENKPGGGAKVQLVFHHGALAKAVEESAPAQEAAAETSTVDNS